MIVTVLEGLYGKKVIDLMDKDWSGNHGLHYITGVNGHGSNYQPTLHLRDFLLA